MTIPANWADKAIAAEYSVSPSEPCSNHRTPSLSFRNREGFTTSFMTFGSAWPDVGAATVPSITTAIPIKGTALKFISNFMIFGKFSESL